MDYIISTLTVAIIRALKAFFNMQPAAAPESSTFLNEGLSEADEASILGEKLSAILDSGGFEDARYTTPFDRQLTRHFKNLSELTRSEVIENFLLALGDTADEINSLVDGDISCSIEQEQSTSYLILHGHLKWTIDKLNPRVYAIAMELLKDGFTFMADSKTFVITSRVKK